MRLQLAGRDLGATREIMALAVAATALGGMIVATIFATRSVSAARMATHADLSVARNAGPLGRSFKVLYTFTGGADGAIPVSPLIRDAQGNLYGTTSSGGDTSSSRCGGAMGCGVVFELSPSGDQTVLYTFTGLDGSTPVAGLVMDASGNLYGTTELGGNESMDCFDSCGVVFKLSPPMTKGEPWTETVLHSFSGPDGENPVTGLTLDGKGNAYGVTYFGGAHSEGTLFKLDASGTETILYNFCESMNPFGNCEDGNRPAGGLIFDAAAGSLYGTTADGGIEEDDFAFGTVYMFTLAGGHSLLHSFQSSPSDGASPTGTLVRDAAGNFYGTTVVGGNGYCADFSCGTVFEVPSGGQDVILHSFYGGADGGNPMGGLLRSSTGNLFGTTVIGGSGNCTTYNQGTGCGTIFEVSANGEERVIHSFASSSDGAFPEAGLITDGKGHEYGTSAGTYFGGNYGYGNVFEISQ